MARVVGPEGDDLLSHDSSEPAQDVTTIREVIRRVFPTTPMTVERVREGGSTYVYRLGTEGESFYLRVLPEEGASFRPEAAVHRWLREDGVKVPEVVYVEQYNALVRRSIMVTTEIPGIPLNRSTGLSRSEIERILVEAGEDLARVNGVRVDGFGWIDREEIGSGGLQAPWQTYRAFATEFWNEDLAFLARTVLDQTEAIALDRVVAHHATWLQSDAGCLAHGDFDATHIYQQDGQYTGLIDFGEIRGTDRWYDLGHFHFRDGEYLPFPLEPFLVRGYGNRFSLPSDHVARIRIASILINVRSLARSLQKVPLNRFMRHQLAVLRADLVAFR